MAPLFLLAAPCLSGMKTRFFCSALFKCLQKVSLLIYAHCWPFSNFLAATVTAQTISGFRVNLTNTYAG